ncbi:hypothetical protein OH77DRAFT_1477050 [Trametes cingulata]|nr:hypothetical protein OH77DRAFT_1477050 [Trametes cingulata]
MEQLTRSETLQMLASMDIELPNAAALSDDALDKRLKAALDAAQEKERFSDRLPLNLRDLPEWPLVQADELRSDARPLLEAVSRGNLREIRDRNMPDLLGAGGGPQEEFGYPFVALRKTTMSMTDVLDHGLTWCIIQDPANKERAINFRVLRVYELDQHTPAIVLLYRKVSSGNAVDAARWCQHQMRSNPVNVPGAGVSINATELVQKLLLKLLDMNKKLLPSHYNPRRGRYEEQFRASVLLPLGPLEYEAISRISGTTGCAVCGARRVFRCKQCQTVQYCSAECQRADWPTHKDPCRSLNLQSGKWCTVKFRVTLPGLEGLRYSSTINQYTNLTRMMDDHQTTTLQDTERPYPNAHGDNPFVVKLQVGLGGRPTHMMVYDRQRSFNSVYVTIGDNPREFAELVAEMEGPRGGFGGLKMYRWAKRTGDWELSICVDRPPQGDVRW